MLNTRYKITDILKSIETNNFSNWAIKMGLMAFQLGSCIFRP